MTSIIGQTIGMMMCEEYTNPQTAEQAMHNATLPVDRLVREAILKERYRCAVRGRIAQLEGKVVDEEIMKEPQE